MRKITFLLYLGALSLLAPKTFAQAQKTATIITDATNCGVATTNTNLQALLVAAGHSVTMVTSGTAPATLIGQTQVWEIGCNTPISPTSNSLYGLFAGCGALFLMGKIQATQLAGMRV
jgi:hypothetical protein